jgi:nitrogen fixation protein NifU and related proteins
MKHAEDLAQCMGVLAGYGKKTGKCGDTIEFFVSVEDGILKTVSYKIEGCAYTRSCAGTTALLAEGKSVEQAWEITPDNIFDYLKTLPPDHFHCAELAVGALYQAMSDFQKKFLQAN